MTAPDAPRLTAKAVAALIGENERTVQGWFARAGHAAVRTRAGYPLPVVAEVLADADRAVPPDVLAREAAVTPQRRRRPRKDAPTPAPQGAPDALAVRPDAALERARDDARMAIYPQLDALQRQLIASQEQQAAMATELAAMREKMDRLLADAAAQRERDEKATQSAQDATVAALAGIEEIKARLPARRKRWWRR